MSRILRRQHCVITRSQATGAGYPGWKVDRFVASGRWLVVYPGAYRPVEVALTEHGRLLAACLVTGGRASHRSAGWLWKLVEATPRRPSVSVRSGATNGRSGIEIHRACDLPRVAGTLHGIPTTSCARTLVDLASVLPADQLGDAVDRAVARQLVDVPELDRALRAARGRRGAGALRRSLGRGYAGGPTPSVLEARFTRLMRRNDLGVERERPVVWEGSRYRLDFVIEGRLPAEVDGFAFHANPGHLLADRRRHNALKLAGREPLVFTWWDVERDPDRVVGVIRQGLAQLTTPGSLRR